MSLISGINQIQLQAILLSCPRRWRGFVAFLLKVYNQDLQLLCGENLAWKTIPRKETAMICVTISAMSGSQSTMVLL